MVGRRKTQVLQEEELRIFGRRLVMKYWKESKCEELKVNQRILIQAIEGSSKVLESSKTRGAHRMVSSINRHIISIVKDRVFLCIKLLVFVFFYQY